MTATRYVCLFFMLLCSALSMTPTAMPETQQCCYPKQFEAVLGILGGMPADDIPTILRRQHFLHFDQDNQWWAHKIVQIHDNGKVDVYLWVEDHNKGFITIYREGCFRLPLNTSQTMGLPCIPEAAVFTDTYRIGRADEQLNYDVWEWDGNPDDPESSGTHFYASVLHNTCLPMNEIGFRDINGYFSVAHIEFLNITLGIGDGNFLDYLDGIPCQDLDELPKSIIRTAPIDYFRQRFRA